MEPKLLALSNLEIIIDIKSTGSLETTVENERSKIFVLPKKTVTPTIFVRQIMPRVKAVLCYLLYLLFSYLAVFVVGHLLRPA